MHAICKTTWLDKQGLKSVNGIRTRKPIEIYSGLTWGERRRSRGWVVVGYTPPFDTQGATPYYVTPETRVDKTKKTDYQASIFLRLGVIWFDYILFYSREAVRSVLPCVPPPQKKRCHHINKKIISILLLVVHGRSAIYGNKRTHFFLFANLKVVKKRTRVAM